MHVNRDVSPETRNSVVVTESNGTNVFIVSVALQEDLVPPRSI